MDTLKVTPISKAQAKQRMGRAGREGRGHYKVSRDLF